MDPYYKTAGIDDEIAKKIEELKSVCYDKKRAMYVTVAGINNPPDKTAYATTKVTPETIGIELCDDRIVKHIQVDMGFSVIESRPPIEIEMDIDVSEDDSE